MFKIEIWNGEFNEVFEVDAEIEIIFSGQKLTAISFDCRRDSERLSLEATRDLISDFRHVFSRYTKTEDKLLKDYQDIPIDSKQQASLSAKEIEESTIHYRSYSDDSSGQASMRLDGILGSNEDLPATVPYMGLSRENISFLKDEEVDKDVLDTDAARYE